MEELAFEIILTDNYDVAVEKVTEALKTEGFGVLTRIDVKETLKKKLDEDFRPYIILGACNPPLAHRALSNEPLVGVMLPCNVTVEQYAEGSRVQIIKPRAMLGVGVLGDNDALCSVADEAHERLERVADLLASQSA